MFPVGAPVVALLTSRPDRLGKDVPRPRLPLKSSVIRTTGWVVPLGVVVKFMNVPWAASVQVSAAVTAKPDTKPLKPVAPYPRPPTIASASPFSTPDGAPTVPRAFRPPRTEPKLLLP